MASRVYGDMTVAHAKREDLADDIASLVGLGVRAVRNRLEQTHGKTRLRVAFEAEWPPPRIELARLTTSTALELNLAAAIATVVDLTPRQVRGRLSRVERGNTLVGNVFVDDWPDDDDPDDAPDDEEEDDNYVIGTDPDFEELTVMSVADARRRALTGEIADRTGLGVRQVRARLRAAHGNALVGNIFLEHWPLPRVDPRATVSVAARPTGTVIVGSGRQPEVAPKSLINGRFRLLRSLGRGGQGEAFEARDEQIPEREVVVLKFASTDAVTREFSIAMKFHHEHICRYFDVAVDEHRRRFLVIEHGGQSLESFIKQRGAVSAREAMRIIVQAANALDYAHSKGVIHHDVSPGNVLIDSGGHVRVTDFGISVLGTTRTLIGGGRTMIANTLLGRHPVYAAPEIGRGEQVRKSADQYSLALVLCSLLEGKTFTNLYKPREFQRLSPHQNAVLRRALRDNADQRFPSCVAFADALGGA